MDAGGSYNLQRCYGNCLGCVGGFGSSFVFGIPDAGESGSISFDLAVDAFVDVFHRAYDRQSLQNGQVSECCDKSCLLSDAAFVGGDDPL